MAQFAAQGRFKAISGCNGAAIERSSLGLKLLSCNGGCIRWVDSYPLRSHKSKPRKIGHSRRARIYIPSAATANTDMSSGDGGAQSVSSWDDEDLEYENDELSCFRGLVLDISYRPVNVVCWKRAICLEFMEKADVLEYYDQTVNSASGSFYIPAVLRVPNLLQVMKRKKIRNTLSRKNIFYRDDYTCQYCSSTRNLTIDHVIPIARGGKWTWENLVTACSECNTKKGPKTPKEANMELAKIPKAPKDFDIMAIPLTGEAVRMLRKSGTPEEWRHYLSKSASNL